MKQYKIIRLGKPMVNHESRFDPEAVKAYMDFDQGSFSWRFIEAPVFTSYLEGKVNSETMLLDLACGTGRITKHLEGIGLNPANAYGIDISPDMVGEATRRVPGAHFVIGDVLQPLPFRDNSFDIAITNHLHQFFDDSEIRQVVKEVVRTLRPGGRYLFVEPNPYEIPDDPLLGKIVESVHTPFGRDINSFRHDYRKILPEIAQEAGLKIEELSFPDVLPGGETDNPREYQRYTATRRRICICLRKP